MNRGFLDDKPREYLHRAGKLTPSSFSRLFNERDATFLAYPILSRTHSWDVLSLYDILKSLRYGQHAEFSLMKNANNGLVSINIKNDNIIPTLDA